jgi:membrane protease YdiL (CAAX protease family)
MLPLMRRRPLAAYVVLTFAISWGGVLLLIGTRAIWGTAPTDGPRFLYALLAMLAGPSVASLLLTATLEGRDGLTELWSRIARWRVPVCWYAVALLAAPLLWMATLLVLSSISPVFSAGIVTAPDKPGRILAGLAVALAAGCVEELGWTGFATPRLRHRHGILATGWILGAIWGLWHLLTNVLWSSAALAGGLPRSFYLTLSVAGLVVGYLPAFRVLMVWVYERTQSLLVAMLMHVSLTASVLIFEPEGLSGAELLTCAFALAATTWAAVGAVAAWNRWSFSGGPWKQVSHARQL